MVDYGLDRGAWETFYMQQGSLFHITVNGVLNQLDRILQKPSCSCESRWLKEIIKNNSPSLVYTFRLIITQGRRINRQEAWDSSSSFLDFRKLQKLLQHATFLCCSRQHLKWAPGRKLTSRWQPVPAGDTNSNKAKGLKRLRRRDINERRGERTPGSEHGEQNTEMHSN